MKTIEEWKPVVGYEDLYEVSNQGRVRSRGRVSSDGSRRKGRLLNPRGMKHLFVTLSRNGVKAQPYVHRLVLEAFSGSAPVGTVGCHRDDDTQNNMLENLYWGTYSENLTDAVRNGKRTHPGRRKSLTESEVQIIRERVKMGETQKSIAADFGVHPSSVSLIVNGKVWGHVA